MMLISIIRVFPFPGNEHAVIDMFNSMKGPLATLPDCIGCSVMFESSEENAICYMERWYTREGLNAHLCSSLYSRVLEAMELSRLQPTIEFLEATEIGCLEYIEKARSPKEDSNIAD